MDSVSAIEVFKVMIHAATPAVTAVVVSIIQ